MAKLTLGVKHGKLVAATTDGTPVLMGTPEFVVSKYGLYLVFPEVNEKVLVQIPGHKIFEEFKVKGSSTPIFRQVRNSGSLTPGSWHISANAINIQ